MALTIPSVYWINLDSNEDRRSHMEEQFSRLGIRNHHRVSAITSNSSEYILKRLELPCKRNTKRDVSVLLSHLKAIRMAVSEATPTRPPTAMDDFALILEDDVKFLYDVDFPLLVRSAPSDFGILQLVTSNIEAIQGLGDR